MAGGDEPGGVEDQSDDAGDATGLTLPPELETYLTPELWRRLNSPAAPRGVLMNALERVRSVLYLLSTFLPAHLVQEKMRRPVPGLVSGQTLRGTLLFSDVSGFTALSERLAGLGAEGAERLTSIMNDYFAAMLEILAWSGGTLLKFAGDATLVYFPEQDKGQQAEWAVRAGQRMLRGMARFSAITTPVEKVRLTMKIGVASGEFLAASIGSADRMEYAVLGPAVALTMAAEGAATAAGQLLVDRATRACLGPAFKCKEHTAGTAGGYAQVLSDDDSPLDDFEIRAETRRARGAIPWSASPHAILAQIEVALRQVQALRPYLAEELAEQIFANARQRRLQSQFRPTTVLFLNFQGADKLLELWQDPGGVNRVTGLLSAYFSALHGVLSRYGGIISRIDPYSKGTKMLVLFGAPVAHEDDPQRAVSAALTMNVELDALNEGWRKKHARHLPAGLSGPLIQHRIGITTGEAFAGQVGASTRREYTVMGDDVNLAARLMGMAEMGQILLSKRIQDAVCDYFVLTPLPPVKVKGKREAVPIFQVESPREDTLLNRVRGRGALIGRDAELAQAGRALQGVLAGRGALLAIQGPAGIGKSHLVDALLNQALEQGARLVLSQCHSYTSQTPHACWRALLRSLAGITLYDYRPQVQQEKLQRLLETAGLSGRLYASLATLLGIRTTTAPTGPEAASGDESGFFDRVKQGRASRRASQLDLWDQLDEQGSSDAGLDWQPLPESLSERERTAAYAAVWSLLAGLAQQAPLVLFFEDAHWMDADSRQLLNSLRKRLPQTGLFILLAQRGAEADEAAAEAAAQDYLNMGPLSPTGTTALVAHLLVADLAQTIHEQSNGNPLFVEEITRWLQRTQNLRTEELKGILQASNILQNLVLSSLESLPAEQREIARVAAVIGEEFRTSEVQALLQASLDPVTLSNHLRSLARARLIALAEAGADARYSFQQSLVRDILYNSLPFERRRELHGRLADYLSEPTSRRRAVHARIAAVLGAEPAGNPVQEAEIIAGHYEQAARWQAAAQHLFLAGSQLVRLNDRPRAAALYTRALGDLGRLPDEGLDGDGLALKRQLALGQGDLALAAADFGAALAAYELARLSLGEGERPELLARILVRLALVLPLHKRADEAEKAVHQALDLLGRADQAPAAAALSWLLWREDHPEAAAAIRRSRKLLAAEGGPWSEGVRVMLDDLEGEWAAVQEGYLGLGWVEGAALANIRLGDQALQQGELPGAQARYQQARELLHNPGGSVQPWAAYGLALASFREAEALWQAQNWEPAGSLLREAQAHLNTAPPAWQATPRRAIQQALKVVNSSKARRWPAWKWQVWDDAFRARLLFKP